MPRRRIKLQTEPVSTTLPAAMVERMDRVAPVVEGRRSAFIRKAIEAELERAEREAERASA